MHFHSEKKKYYYYAEGQGHLYQLCISVYPFFCLSVCLSIRPSVDTHRHLRGAYHRLSVCLPITTVGSGRMVDEIQSDTLWASASSILSVSWLLAILKNKTDRRVAIKKSFSHQKINRNILKRIKLEK